MFPITPSAPSNGLYRPARLNLRDEVSAYLREEIFAGRLRPGTKIDQDGVAVTMGISKLPVREALIALEAEGLVNSIPRRGAYVAMLTADDFHDHYRVYGRVVAIAAERAAGRITLDELEILDRLVDRMEMWVYGDQDDERLNFQFHRLINRAGASRRLKSVLKSLAQAMPEKLYHETRGWSKPAQREHRAIVTALRNGDGLAAAAASIEHIEAGAEQVIRSLTNSGFFASDPADGPANASSEPTAR